MKRPDTIFVRNNGTEPFADRYDGEDFSVGPGDAVEIEADCAKLVFGFGEKDKTRAVKRLGWAPTQAEMPRALALLNSFSFHMEQPEDGEDGILACSSAPASDTEPAPDASADGAGTDQTADVVVREGGKAARRQRSASETLARVQQAAG